MNRGHFIGLGTIDRVGQDGDKDSLRSRLYAENFGDFHFHGCGGFSTFSTLCGWYWSNATGSLPWLPQQSDRPFYGITNEGQASLCEVQRFNTHFS